MTDEARLLRRRERRRLRREKRKSEAAAAKAKLFAEDKPSPRLLDDEVGDEDMPELVGKKSAKKIGKHSGRLSRSSSLAVKIGVLMPISDDGLKYVERVDPELAILIKEKNPRFRR